jgi:hypothetical protein
MGEKKKGGFRQARIPDDFRKATDETRGRLKDAAKQDAPLAELITRLIISHAEALKNGLTDLTTVYRHNRPDNPSEFRRFMRDEVNGIWYIHEIMDSDFMLIRRLGSRIETSIPSLFKEEWQNTLKQVDKAINGSLDVVRASLDGWDKEKTSNQRREARQRAIGTLADLAGQWSAIANTLTTIEKEFPQEASRSGAAPAAAPENDARPGNRSATG